MEVIKNKYIAIKSHVDGEPQESHFELKIEALPLSIEPGSNDVIVKSLNLSIDPYQINRMKSDSSSHKASSYSVPIIPGEAIDACGVGRVLASEHPGFQKDDLVAGVIKWGGIYHSKAGQDVKQVGLHGLSTVLPCRNFR